MKPTPETTIAVVVGIEEYDAGDAWRLDGPVSDSCRFVDWLLERGVPPANITLLTAPLPANRGLVEDRERRGVRAIEASAESVRRQLVTELPGQECSLLIIHWGGHGVLDADENRRLIYPDARSDDRRNLNLTSLLRSLRTTTYRRQPHQQIIVDACSTLVSSLRWEHALPDETYPGGKDSVRDQAVLLATSAGEQALNIDARKTGCFSELVLTELRRLPAGQWPPALRTVDEQVDIALRLLRDEGTTEQVPSRLWYRDRSTVRESVYDTTPKRRRRRAVIAAAAFTAVVATVASSLFLPPGSAVRVEDVAQRGTLDHAVTDVLVSDTDRAAFRTGAQAMQLLNAHGQVSVDRLTVGFTLTGNRLPPIRITDIEPEIVATEPVISGTLFMDVSQGQTPAIKLAASLDAAQPIVHAPEQLKTSWFSDHHVRLGFTESQQVEITFAARLFTYSFRVKVHYSTSYGAHGETTVTAPGGAPFTVTGRPADGRYRAVYRYLDFPSPNGWQLCVPSAEDSCVQ